MLQLGDKGLGIVQIVDRKNRGAKFAVQDGLVFNALTQGDEELAENWWR